MVKFHRPKGRTGGAFGDARGTFFGKSQFDGKVRPVSKTPQVNPLSLMPEGELWARKQELTTQLQEVRSAIARGGTTPGLPAREKEINRKLNAVTLEILNRK